VSGPRRALCERVVRDLLAGYVAGTLDAPDAAALERHLQGCPPCAAYLATYRATVGLARAARPEMPAEMAARLRAFLLERLGAG
jgi:anti-sigma factor RsiW